ncbi:MAG: flavodoxin [Acutalibacteraceae bacterium]
MKKIVSLFMALAMVLSLAACSTNENTSAPSNINGKNLVVYFSMPDNVDNSTVVIDGETLGNTQYMAYVIEETVGADIFRIEPETPYPTDHDTLVDLAKEEQNDNARPKIKDTIENFDTYENIFVGYPNWWGDMPMILYSFFDEYDFSGKTIIPFNTHGGSGFSNTISTIKELEPNAEVLDGKSISRNDIQDAEQEIIDWVKSLGFEQTAAQNPTDEAGKTLVVYYSATGNTENVANYIAAATNGDLFKLEPAEPYSDADLNWTDDNSRVVYEHDNPDERDVALVKSTVENWDEYDTVFIGYPIWWGIAAWPVDGFIEANDFTGKTVIPFATSSSSGLGESGKLLSEMAGEGNWLEGERFRSGVSEADVTEWVNSLEK